MKGREKRVLRWRRLKDGADRLYQRIQYGFYVVGRTHWKRPWQPWMGLFDLSPGHGWRVSSPSQTFGPFARRADAKRFVEERMKQVLASRKST